MPTEPPTLAPAPSSRLIAIDAARGVAIVAMVYFHLMWDLSFLGFLGYDITEDVRWVIFQRSILASFLILVGIGLVLGHGEAIRWRAFWRRWTILAAAALAMSAGTAVAFGDALAVFGILHAIALFSLMGLAALRLPVWGLVLAALIFIVPPIAWQDAAFNPSSIAWIGFYTVPPRTVDLVPIFPWFGATLLGMAAAKILPWPQIAGWSAQWATSIATLGRWSLVIYLVHQPLLFGGLTLLSAVMPPGMSVAEAGPPPALFVAECEPSCVETGGPVGYCQSYCLCAIDAIEEASLWDAVAAQSPTPAERDSIDAVINLCRAMAE